MKEVEYIHNIFKKNNIEIRIVGGFVRDKILGKTSDDIDLVTTSTPQVTIATLNANNIKYNANNSAHGVIIAIINNKAFEISSLRKDVQCYGRKAKVEFIDKFNIDAQRRDFTINALYQDFSGKIYDFFSGKKDLEKGIIQFIGDPQLRIKEDYLRILRFFRFTTYYGKYVNQPAINSIKKLQHNLKNISAERINSEFSKLLICQRKLWLVHILQNMANCGIFNILFSIENIDITNLKRVFILEKALSHKFTYNNIIYLTSLINKENTANIKQIFSSLKIANKQKNYLAKILKLSTHFSQEMSFVNIIEVAINLELEDKNLIADALILNSAKFWKKIAINLFLQKLKTFNFPKVNIEDIDLSIFQGKNIKEEIKKRKILKIKQNEQNSR